MFESFMSLLESATLCFIRLLFVVRIVLVNRFNGLRSFNGFRRLFFLFAFYDRLGVFIFRTLFALLQKKCIKIYRPIPTNNRRKRRRFYRVNGYPLRSVRKVLVPSWQVLFPICLTWRPTAFACNRILFLMLLSYV